MYVYIGVFIASSKLQINCQPLSLSLNHIFRHFLSFLFFSLSSNLFNFAASISLLHHVQGPYLREKSTETSISKSKGTRWSWRRLSNTNFRWLQNSDRPELPTHTTETSRSICEQEEMDGVALLWNHKAWGVGILLSIKLRIS